MEEAENIFTENELEALIALHEGGNVHDFALEIFRKAKENSGNPEVPDDFFETNIAAQLEETIDNPVISMLPIENLIGILYMSFESALSDKEEDFDDTDVTEAE